MQGKTFGGYFQAYSTLSQALSGCTEFGEEGIRVGRAGLRVSERGARRSGALGKSWSYGASFKVNSSDAADVPALLGVPVD